MATGQAAMHVTGSWMCAQYGDPTFTDQPLGFYPFPEMPGGLGKITDIMGQTDIGFAATHVAVKEGRGCKVYEVCDECRGVLR